VKISIVSPLFRSARYLPSLYVRCVATLERMRIDDYEIILVNDASPEDDLAVAKRLADHNHRVHVIDLARNYGQQRALMIGFEHTSGDFVFVLDSDLEEDPEWLESFYQVMIEKQCDVVYGMQTGKKRGFWYRTGRALFLRAIRLLSDVAIPEGAITARLMSKRYVQAVCRFREHEIDIGAVWALAGFAQVPVPVRKLDTSPTSYTIGKLLRVVINSVTSVSTRPLIAGAVLGVVMCLIALVYTIAVVAAKLFYGVSIQGWPSLMSAVLILGGLNLLLTGTVAIYVAKVFIEVKQRPAGLIRELYSSVKQPLSRGRLETVDNPLARDDGARHATRSGA
jgi:putative glycosyltransferase